MGVAIARVKLPGGNTRVRGARRYCIWTTETTPMKIQASIAGYAGQPITLLGFLDKDTGVLIVAKEVKYRENREAPDFALVSNLDLPDLDMKLTDDLLRDTIRSYYTRKSQMTMEVTKEVQRYEPDNKIDLEAVDENGRRYKIDPNIQNGQIAVLAMVALIEKQVGFAAAMDMASELKDFYTVHTI